MSKCRTCGAAVLWALSSSGKKIPLDPTPVAGGNVELRSGDPPSAIVHRPGSTPAPNEVRYVSHFSTCPDAKSWRGGRPPKKPVPRALTREERRALNLRRYGCW